MGRHADAAAWPSTSSRPAPAAGSSASSSGGRKHELGLGSIALVTLAEAREQAFANRKLGRAGGDPLAERRRARGMPTFAGAATAVVEQKRAGWRSPKQAQDWLRSLERYAVPRIGNRPVCEVNSADVLQILTPIWHVRMQTARTVRQRIRGVLEWAVAMEMRGDNPCDRVLPVLGPQNEVGEEREHQSDGEEISHGERARLPSETRRTKGRRGENKGRRLHA